MKVKTNVLLSNLGHSTLQEKILNKESENFQSQCKQNVNYEK